jgi:hypothetical protein
MMIIRYWLEQLQRQFFHDLAAAGYLMCTEIVESQESAAQPLSTTGTDGIVRSGNQHDSSSTVVNDCR